MDYDLSNQHITLTPKNMTSGIKEAVVNAQQRIDELLSGQDGLNDAVETALNDLKSQITALDVANGADVEELQTKINILNDIFSKDGNANDVFDAIVSIANAWNNAGDIVLSKEIDFNSSNGEMVIDLTPFGFSSVNDYTLVGSIDPKGATVARVGFTKVSETQAKVVAIDAAYFVEDAIKYNASGEGSFLVSLNIQYPRTKLSFVLSDETGSQTTV